jgi:hypothetical protein
VQASARLEAIAERDTAKEKLKTLPKVEWTIEPGSPASLEVANVETRLDGSPWGDRPVRAVYAYAQMATKLTAEFSRCAGLLIGADRPAPGIETEVQPALEAGSVSWWLLQPGLSARQRVCRMQLLRRNSAREYARSIAAVGEDPAIAGNETIAAVEAECRALGLTPFTHGGDRLEGQERLTYTKRVEALTDELGNHGAYSFYSGAAHAELSGIWRMLAQTGATLPRPAPAVRPRRQSAGIARAGRQRPEGDDDDGACRAHHIALRVDRARPKRPDK